MKELQQDILHCIGNTSLLALRSIVPDNGSRILLKALIGLMASQRAL